MFRVIGILVLVSFCCVAWAKEGRTYYTDERIAVGRENFSLYPWAQGLRERIFETGDPIVYYTGAGKYTAADVFAAQSDDFMWLLQPPTVIPRMYDFNEAGGRTRCPVCGDEVTKISVWNAWRIDPVTHPYQVQCQMCNGWFPSNRYHEGDMTSGDYPDDGEGWVHDGKRYCFLREYAHMCYGSVVIPTLHALSEAYLLTGDAKYARKGSILLARLATEYPNYGWDHVTPRPDLENRFERTYLGRYDNHHPYYTWKQGGMITDLIWETFALEPTAYAYDAFYDYLGTDPELIAFLREKGMAIADAEELRDYIEDYIFRSAMVGLLDGWIKGNEGFHQAAALAVALVMDDYSDTHPNSKDMVDYAYHGIGQSAYMLVNGLDRDGGGHESPNYNRIKRDFIRVAQLMEEVRRRHPEEYPLEQYPDLFAHAKPRGLFDYYIDITLLDTFLPSIGDCGGISRPSRYPDSNRKYSLLTSENLYAFSRYGDPRYARASTTMAGKPFPGSLWEPYPAAAIKEALAKPESAIKRESRLLDGYGVAILESGEWPQSRAAVLNYTSTVGHRQNDQLMLELFARGVSVLPDLGYPRTWDYRYEWDSNSLAHNTVTVNETRPVMRSFRNGARLFASAEGVHVAVAHHNPYPEGMGLGAKGAAPVDLYERSVVMVDVDDERFYVVDLFAVNGGEQHDQSWHAMLVPCEAPELDWQAQETGTLAGPDVAQFAPYTDRWGRDYTTGNFPCFVSDVRRAELVQPAAWTWPSGLPEGDTLRMHVVPVGGPAEVVMGRGRSPVWPENETLDYLFVRRRVENGAASRFLTVLDGYQDQPTVEGVRVLSEAPLVLEVTRADGVDDITIHLPDGPSRTTAHRPVGVRVVSRNEEGAGTRNVRVGDMGDGSANGYAHGTILEVDYEKHRVTIETQPGSEKDFVAGRAIRVFNGMRSGMLRIVAAEPRQGRVTLTLDKTALMAQLPITAVREGKVRLGVKTPFITGHLVSASEDLPADVRGTAVLTDGPNDYYYGCWLGEGKAARLVQGIANASPPWLHFAEPAEDTVLTEDYGGKIVPLWLYGVGDSVEVARIEEDAGPSAAGMSLRSPLGLLMNAMIGALPEADRDGVSRASCWNHPNSSLRGVPDEAISSLEQERDCRVARGLAPRNDAKGSQLEART
jgi:oligo-alginate lyase